MLIDGKKVHPLFFLLKGEPYESWNRVAVYRPYIHCGTYTHAITRLTVCRGLVLEQCRSSW